ncbi:MAG: adenylate/guanylate cyclase domain-containing protein [Elusimicrobiota bacterium]
MLRRAWNGFRRLHLALYFIFFLVWGWGGFMSNIFEKYSLIDVGLLRTEMGKALDARTGKVNFKIDDALAKRIFRPLNDAFLQARTRAELAAAPPGPQKNARFRINIGGEEGTWFCVAMIALWLWPLYRYYYFPDKPDPLQVERRIIGLPVLLFALVWGCAAYRYFVRSGSFAVLYGPPTMRIKTVFAAAAVMFGVFVSYLNLELTGLYVRRFIARPFFAAHDPHRLRQGVAINLGMRYALMIFSLAVFPLLLSLYVPVFFNLDALRGLRGGFTSDSIVCLYQNGSVLIPCLIVAVLAAVLLVFQAASLLLFRWNVQAPIGALVNRMKAVAAGDFSCKTSVLYSDEIGQLKGHFNLMLDGLVEREKIKDTFGKYVSTEIAEKIMKSGKVNLAGEEIQATVMFSDIRNFTPLSEKLTPTELIGFLNDYFAHVTAPIMANQGVINKFMGDAVMALFSPIFGVENHADAALRAALGMKEALARFNALGAHAPVAFGIGLHTGTLIAGNVGAENRLEYTVLGDTVNVASRVEGQTKQFSTEILMSEAVLAAIDRARFPGTEFVECGPVLMKGKSKPMLLYKVATPAIGAKEVT